MEHSVTIESADIGRKLRVVSDSDVRIVGLEAISGNMILESDLGDGWLLLWRNPFNTYSGKWRKTRFGGKWILVKIEDKDGEYTILQSFHMMAGRRKSDSREYLINYYVK